MANMVLDMDLEHPALDENIRDWVKVFSTLYCWSTLSPPTPSQDGKVLFIPSLLATPFLAARYQSVPSDKIASKVSVGGKALSEF